MKQKNIPKRLSIKRPLSINTHRGGVKILGADMKGSRSRIKIFRPIRPGARQGGNGCKDCGQPGQPALAGCFNYLICFTYFWSTCCSR